MSQILDSELFISCVLDQYQGTGDVPSEIKKWSCMEIGAFVCTRHFRNVVMVKNKVLFLFTFL